RHRRRAPARSLPPPPPTMSTAPAPVGPAASPLLRVPQLQDAPSILAADGGKIAPGDPASVLNPRRRRIVCGVLVIFSSDANGQHALPYFHRRAALSQAAPSRRSHCRMEAAGAGRA